MQPNHYADIILYRRDAITIPVIASKVIQQLHSFFVERPNAYAIALPKMRRGDSPKIGDVIRVFAGSRDEVDAAMDRMESVDDLKPYIMTGRVKQVPDEHHGLWVQYTRLRIPSRKARNPKYQEFQSSLRANRLSNDLPYFAVSSNTSHNDFFLFVDQVNHEMRLSEVGETDSYGLSKKSMPVVLPHITNKD